MGSSTQLPFDARRLLCDGSNRHEFMVSFHEDQEVCLGLPSLLYTATHRGSEEVGQIFFPMKYHMSSCPHGVPKIHNAELKKPSILTLKITVSNPLIPAGNKRGSVDTQVRWKQDILGLRAVSQSLSLLSHQFFSFHRSLPSFSIFSSSSFLLLSLSISPHTCSLFCVWPPSQLRHPQLYNLSVPSGNCPKLASVCPGPTSISCPSSHLVPSTLRSNFAIISLFLTDNLVYSVSPVLMGKSTDWLPLIR